MPGRLSLKLVVGGKRGTGDTTFSPETSAQRVVAAPPPLAASSPLNVSGSSPVAQAPAV